MPLLFALISYIGWGVGDIFGTIATRKIGAYSTTFWYLFFSLLIFGPIGFFYLDDLQNLTLEVLLLNVFLGILGTIGLIAFYEGLRIANASLVGTIAASFAAVTVVLSIVFLGEVITSNQAAAIILIFIGLVLASLEFKELKSLRKINKGVLFAVVAMLTWGIYWAFIKIPIQEIGWFWPAFIAIWTFPIILIPMRYRKEKLARPGSKGAFRPLVLNAILLGVAAFSFNLAIERGLTAVVAPIAGSYPTLFVVLAFIVFRDAITRQQIAGIVITLIGIVFLSFFSV